MSTNKQALRNSADRDWFEEWFKKEYHPNKTGPYIKDQMFFAIHAARAPLLDELEAAKARIADLEAREVVLPPLVDCSNVPFAAYSWNAYRAEAVKALRAAGITVEGE